MEYNIEFFSQKKKITLKSDYRYMIEGGFYTVYTNGDGDFHMAKEDEKSLHARASFYKKFICNDKYPFFNRKYGIDKDVHADNENLIQVLGLPEEVTYEKKGDIIHYLNADEILSRIHFDENIHPKYNRPDKEDSSILETNDPSLISLINHLIENGFYILNPERFMDVSSLSENGYMPLYIDEELIPDWLLKEKETSHKLVMDFVNDPFLITRDVFIEHFAPLDRMSINEKAKLAFDRQNEGITDAGRKEMIIALRRYFLALARKLANDFYNEKFNIRGIFGFTVLDHDFEFIDAYHRYVYLGSRFDMYAQRIRNITLGEDGNIRQDFEVGPYLLDSKNKKKVGIAFRCVKKYFLRHKEYAFLPCVFLRMMGLPYPAFETVKYIDLERIDEKAFVRLFIFDMFVSYTNFGLILTTLSLEGNQISMKDWNTRIPYYMKESASEQTFISNFSGFMNIGYNNFLFFHEKSRTGKLNQLFGGETLVYKEAYNNFEDSCNKLHKSFPQSESLKSFLISQDRNGVLVVIRKYFEYLCSGLDSLEAKREIQKETDVDFTIMHFLINMAFFFILEPTADKFIKRIADNRLSNPDPLILTETFYDPYLKYPYVIRGRNFTAYGDKDGNYYLDEDDKEAIRNLIRLYETRFNHHEYQAFPYTIDAFGKDIPKFYESDDYPDDKLSLLQFLGLPIHIFNTLLLKKVCVENLFFEKNISMYHEKRHLKLLKEDTSLSYSYIFSLAARKGIYLNGRRKNPRNVYCLKKKTDPLSDLYLKAENIQEYCIEASKETPRSYYTYSRMPKSIFQEEFLDILLDESYLGPIGKTDASEYPLTYGGLLLNAFYGHLHDELFHDEKNEKAVLGYLHEKDGYIALGRCFNCYSRNDDVNSFGFTSKDRDDILKGFEKLKNDYQYGSRRNVILNIIHGLGIPLIMQKRFYDVIRANGINLKKEDIPVVDMEVGSRYSYHGLFEATDYENYGKLYSQKLIREARNLGFMVFASHEVFDPALLSPKDMSDNLRDTYNKIIDCRTLVLDDTSGIIHELVHPTEISFSLSVKDFISSYDKQTKTFSSHFLFYVQELLIYAYHRNPDFIKDYYNRKQRNWDCEADLNFFKDYMEELSLDEVIRKSEHKSVVILVSFFFLYLEQNTLFRISKMISTK